MKKIFLFLSFLMFCWGTSAQNDRIERKYEMTGISTAQAIKNFADSMRISYPYYEIDKIRLDSTVNSITYEFRNLNSYISNIGVIFPVVWDESTTRGIFSVADSLAQTNIYSNKVIANRVSRSLAELGEKGGWQAEIALKAAKTDLKYSAKFTYNSAVQNLPENLYNQEILDLIAEKLENPHRTREEAEIIVKGQKPAFGPFDTTGYSILKDKYMKNTATDIEKRQYNVFDRWLRNIQSQGQTIQQYTDSLNREYYESELERLTGSFWRGSLDIIETAGQKRIYSLAPLIERFATPEIRERVDIDRILARLKYKDYFRQQDEKYTHILDSCIVYLKNNPEHWASDQDMPGGQKVRDMVMKIITIYRTMVYLGVSDLEIVERLTPIVTIKIPTINRSFIFGWRDGQVSIGTYFLSKYIMVIVTNVPVPKDMEILDWDQHDVPIKMYQWLIENKDKYQLRENSKLIWF